MPEPTITCPSCGKKILLTRALRTEIDRRGLDVDIQVDGGINPATVSTVVAAGANVLVAGYGIYRAANGDYAAAIKTLRAAAGAPFDEAVAPQQVVDVHGVPPVAAACSYACSASRLPLTPRANPR